MAMASPARADLPISYRIRDLISSPYTKKGKKNRTIAQKRFGFFVQNSMSVIHNERAPWISNGALSL
jgi:hypothetical protein